MIKKKYCDKRKINVRLPQSVEEKFAQEAIDLKGFIDTNDINKAIQKKLFQVLVADSATKEIIIKKTETEEPFKIKQIHIDFETFKGIKNASYKNDLPDIQVTLSVLTNNYTIKGEN